MTSPNKEDDPVFFLKPSVGGHFWLPKPEIVEELEKITLFLKLHDIKGTVRAHYWTSYRYGNVRSSRPFSLSYYDGFRRYRTTQFKSLDTLREGVQRLIDKT